MLSAVFLHIAGCANHNNLCHLKGRQFLPVLFLLYLQRCDFLLILRPTYICKNVFEITPQRLKSLGIKALLLDVDNTLAIYHTDVPVDGVMQWIEQMQSAGIDLHILSNAKPKRLTRFANNVGLPYFYMSLKPLPFKTNRAIKALGRQKSEVAIVGDQLFTDIMCANLCGIRSFWVDIFQPEDKLSFKIKRKIEGRLRPKYIKIISEVQNNER